MKDFLLFQGPIIPVQQLKIIRNLIFVARSQEFSKMLQGLQVSVPALYSSGRTTPETAAAAEDMVVADDDASSAVMRSQWTASDLDALDEDQARPDGKRRQSQRVRPGSGVQGHRSVRRAS